MLHIQIEKPLHGSSGEMTLFIDNIVNDGEFIALMGESGSGKTTLLRVLAGLEKAKGSIIVDGVSWENMPPQKREIGFVFQDYALFENMNVEENLLFVNQDKALAKQLLEMTALQKLAKRNVQHLSGGQKQRVSLCRAMMKKPKLLLMDEPFSSLDSTMRTKLQHEIKTLHHTFGTTTIMVSHDPAEVYTLAQRVWVLKQGKLIQDSSINELLKQQKNSFKVPILKLTQTPTKTIATVMFSEKIFDIEVNNDVKIGEYIDISFNT